MAINLFSPTTALRLLLLALGMWILPSDAALAQGTWPQRAVKLIIPFPSGGAVDAIARDLANRLSPVWGQPVVVDNKPGGNGVIAADLTAKADADGYTLFMAHDGIATVVPFLQDKLPYDPLADFTPISFFSTLPMVLVASSEAQVGTLGELVSKARGAPGELTYASNGVGNATHIAMELLQHAGNFKLRHVPYKGSAPAMQDIIGGRVDVMWAAIGPVLPQLKSGKLVPLAVSGRERSALAPQVRTLSQAGFPSVDAGNWIGLLGPARMPQPLVRKINEDLRRVMTDPTFVAQQAARGSDLRPGTSEEFARQIRAEFARNKALFASGAIARE